MRRCSSDRKSLSLAINPSSLVCRHRSTTLLPANAISDALNRAATPARCQLEVAWAVTTAREKLKLPLTSTWRQKQTQFASPSSNGSDVTTKLSRHRGHSFLPLRKFDQQLDLLVGPFAGFCRLHCCARSRDRMFQLRPRFGRDEGNRDSPLRFRGRSHEPVFLDKANPLTETWRRIRPNAPNASAGTPLQMDAQADLK